MERSGGTDEVVYDAVAARRLQWDALLWQVPVLSLTAQAFLFTIALGSGSSRFARGVACALSLVAAALSMQLMARHRQAEISDAHWLGDYELAHFGTEMVVHGPAFQQRRNATRAGGPLAHLPAFRVWLAGLALFGVGALVVLAVVLFRPSVL
jgi:hypothetical protein